MSNPAPNKAAKPKTHPSVRVMVTNAIQTLNQRGGSSIKAIKKFMNTEYKVDAEKMSPYIKKFLKSAVQKGELIQTSGKGASGSFKMPPLGKKLPAAGK